MLLLEDQPDESSDEPLDPVLLAIESERLAWDKWNAVSDALDAEYEKANLQPGSRVAEIEKAEAAAFQALGDARRVVLATAPKTTEGALKQLAVAREMIKDGGPVDELLAYIKSLEIFLSRF